MKRVHLAAACGLLLLASCAGSGGDDGDAQARLTDPALGEASGLAFSTTDPGFLWLINDSGSPALVHLAERNGKARGVVGLVGAQNIDWEDIATFRWQGKSWILVADVGDNDGTRQFVSLYLFEEPPLPEKGAALSLNQSEVRRIVFRFPDGPRDCESVAVDPLDGSILLLTKREKAPRLYRLPLVRPAEEEVETAEFLGETSNPPVIEGMPFHLFGKQPCGMDVSRDGRLATVVTYQGVFLIRRLEGESWQAAFARPWVTLGTHRLVQAESVGFSPKGDRVIITSEGVGAPLLEFAVPPEGDD